MDAHYLNWFRDPETHEGNNSVDETLAPHPFLCSLHLDMAAFALLTPPRQEALSHDT
jgi:hypothetical protein